ncbi:CDP-2,3-bis-(O-geranylgeranyl)-sn-glycerol synthase [Candidatus Woesearchaeota archaeon]|nr:CDP-2,3-bis-(O-geranylgeranyl)-sn-glycerol synthase [Candidatus Woesearchaeota archaeon]
MAEILMYVLKAFYLILPAYFANMAPVIGRGIFPRFNIPIDFNKKIKGKPIFGRNKTFRGFIFGILFAVIIAYIQYLLFMYGFFRDISIIDYSNWLVFGFFIGFGAMFGDLAESFIKRQLNLKPGARFVPWDQIDYVLGALLFTDIKFKLDLPLFISIIVLSFMLHILINHIAFYLKIRKEKW